VNEPLTDETAEPANTGRTRDGKGRWLKGTPSPNPTGRPATPADVQAIWDAHTEEAALKVIEVMRTAPEIQDQLRAAMHVLDRRFGKPSQSLDVTARAVDPAALAGQPDAARARLEALIVEAERQLLPAVTSTEPTAQDAESGSAEAASPSENGASDTAASALPVRSTDEGTL
jgi:hypothetical protein